VIDQTKTKKKEGNVDETDSKSKTKKKESDETNVLDGEIEKKKIKTVKTKTKTESTESPSSSEQAEKLEKAPVSNVGPCMGGGGSGALLLPWHRQRPLIPVLLAGQLRAVDEHALLGGRTDRRQRALQFL